MEKSLPSRERGLKFVCFHTDHGYGKSLPSRERGLKFCNSFHFVSCCTSLPSRERGLKLFYNLLPRRNASVAPFAGAWIEISISCSNTSLSLSLPSRERGLKLIGAREMVKKNGRSLRGSVD